MTKKEMTEIFSIMLLAWPNAEMFRGGIKKLGPTIQIWTDCLIDVDCWIAKQAVVELCKECKFPPTIADFREKVNEVNKDINTQISNAIELIRSAKLKYESLDKFYNHLPAQNRTKTVITAMGGPQQLITTINGASMWNWDRFENTYKKLLRREWELQDTYPHASLGAGSKGLTP